MDSGTGLLSDSGYIGLNDPVKEKFGKGLCRGAAALRSVEAQAKRSQYLQPDLWTDL